MHDRSLARLVPLFLAAAALSAPASAQPMIDSFETGSVHLSVKDGIVSQSVAVSSPGHCVAPARFVQLTSYTGSPGPSTVDLSAWSAEDDELKIVFGNTGGEVLLQYDMTANPVDLSEGGFNDRLDFFFHTSTVNGTVEVRLWDVGAGFVQDSLVTAFGPKQFAFSAWAGQIDLSQIIFLQVFIRKATGGVYDLFSIRVQRRDATFLRFDVPVAVEIGPPYPIPPVLFDITDAGGPIERIGVGLANALSQVTGSQVPISMEGTDSGGDPMLFGEVGQVAARWEGAGPWEDSTFEIPVDVSAVSGIDPVPFLPALPAAQMTPTGFLLSFDVWKEDGGGAVVTTSRRQMAFDVPGPQGIALGNVQVSPPEPARTAAGTGFSGFVVSFEAKETGVGMDEAEPIFETSFWGDCAPATATDAPAVAATGARGPALTVRPSVTRSGAELLLSAPARSAGAIDLFDVTGRLVRRLDVTAGTSAVHWDGGAADGRAVSPGVYFLRHAGQEAGGSARVVVVR